MTFRLYYRGQLKPNGKREHKHAIRRALRKQLADLAGRNPLKGWERCFGETAVSGWPHVRKEIDGFSFLPVVSSGLCLVAKLSILFLRPEEPGSIVASGGDIDNRLKTLFDALRLPKPGELTAADKPGQDELPFWCLLEDDALVVEVSVQTDRLLDATDDAETLLIITVTIGASQHITKNAGLASF